MYELSNDQTQACKITTGISGLASISNQCSSGGKAEFPAATNVSITNAGTGIDATIFILSFFII